MVQACMEREGRISDFKDMKQIGEGAFAAVFVGVHKKTGKKHALKQILK